MKTLIRTGTILALLTASAAANAGWSANIGWQSDYYFRGIFQKSSSAQGGVDYETGGFYAGVWAADVGGGFTGDGLEVDGYFGYGYMWWVWDGPKAIGPFEGAYTARGAWGQYITVFPKLDLVLAHKTHNIYRRRTAWASVERIIELLFEAKGVEMPGPYPWS